MAQTWDSRRLRQMRTMEQRFTVEQKSLARAVSALYLRAATTTNGNGEPAVPNTRPAREDLRRAIWEEVLKPYFIGRGMDPFHGPEPQSPFADLLYDGIYGATRLSAERQASIVRQNADEEVTQWLTGPRPMFIPIRQRSQEMRITELISFGGVASPRPSFRDAAGKIDVGAATSALVRSPGSYDAFHTYVDSNGYRLSDRVWVSGLNERSRLDQMIDYHLGQSTGAVEMAEHLEQFLTPGGRESRTRRPYGSEGSHAARRLARTEITAAGGRTTVNAAIANPYTDSIRWRLSSSHPDVDQCDVNARGGPNGDGVYPLDQVPTYPDHPNEMCALVPVSGRPRQEVTNELRDEIRAARGELGDALGAEHAKALQGIMNPDYLTNAVMNGTLDESIAKAIATSRPPTFSPATLKAIAETEAALAQTRENLKAVQRFPNQAKSMQRKIDRLEGELDELRATTSIPGVGTTKVTYRELDTESRAYTKWLKDNYGTSGTSGTTYKSWSTDERAAVDNYVGSAYQEVNDALRTGETLSPEGKKVVAGLDKLGKRTTVSENVVVYRGGVIPELDGMQGLNLKGIEFTDKGFVSTTFNKLDTEWFVGRKNPTVMKIRVTKGTNVIPVAAYNNMESELLLPRGQKFRIVSQSTTKIGRKTVTQITVDLLPPTKVVTKVVIKPKVVHVKVQSTSMRASDLEIKIGSGETRIKMIKASLDTEGFDPDLLARYREKLPEFEKELEGLREQLTTVRRTEIPIKIKGGTYGEWKPSMDRDEALEWSKTSAYKTSSWHTTGLENVESLMNEGFDLELTSFGRVWGDGVYVASDKATTDVYREWMKFSAPQSIETRINVKKFLDIDASTIRLGDDAGVAIVSKARKVSMTEARNILDRRAPSSIGTRGQLRVDTAIQIVREEGFEAIFIHAKEFSKSVGGNQFVVFDSKNVVMIAE